MQIEIGDSSQTKKDLTFSMERVKILRESDFCNLQEHLDELKDRNDPLSSLTQSCGYDKRGLSSVSVFLQWTVIEQHAR